MEFPELSENIINRFLQLYVEGDYPDHIQSIANMLRYARWAKFKIERQKLLIDDSKMEISALGKRVRHLRLELDELKRPGTTGPKI